MSLPPELDSLPLVSGLDPDARSDLARALVRETLPDGAILVRRGEPAAEIFLLVDGELGVRLDDALVTVLAAPAVAGLLAALDGGPRTASLQALGDTTVLRIERGRLTELMEAHPSIARAVVDHLASELRRQYDREALWMNHLADFMRSPGAVIVPGPYEARPFEMLAFLMDGPADRTAALLPPGVSPAPGAGGKWLLVLSFFESVSSRDPAGEGRSFAYAEASPFIPCLGPSLRPAAFCPELYPDNTLAIAIGRELYGFPKRFGRLARSSRRVDVTVAQRLLLRVAWTGERPLTDRAFAAELTAGSIGSGDEPGLLAGLAGALFGALNNDAARPLWPTVPVLMRRRRPAVGASDGDGRWAVDELVEVPFRITHLSSFEALEGAAVRVVDDWFLDGRCVAAFRLRIGFEFEDRILRRDYVSGSEPGAFTRAGRRLDRWLGGRP